MAVEFLKNLITIADSKIFPVTSKCSDTLLFYHIEP